jgi:hypothetical protein
MQPSQRSPDAERLSADERVQLMPKGSSAVFIANAVLSRRSIVATQPLIVSGIETLGGTNVPERGIASV